MTERRDADDRPPSVDAADPRAVDGERRATGRAESAGAGDGGLTGLVAAVLDRLTRTEPWEPPPSSGPRLGAVRQFLDRDDAVRGAERVRLVAANAATGPEADGGPAVVGRSREALLFVTDAGSFRVPLDEVERVERTFESGVTLCWCDLRLFSVVAFLCSVLAFLAVMSTAASPAAPALAMTAGIGALSYTHARSTGVVVRDRTVTDWLRAVPRFGPIADAFERLERDTFGGAESDPFVRWTTATVALAPLAAAVALEPGWTAPLFAVLTVGSFAAVAAGVAHRDAFERLGAVRRRYTTVTVALADDSSVVLRTAPASTLATDLAAGVSPD